VSAPSSPRDSGLQDVAVYGELVRIGGLPLLLCGVLALLGLAAFGIRTSGYWATRMPDAERRRRALRVEATAPYWVGAGWFCLTAGAFVVSHYNWPLLAVVGCICLTQVGFVTWSRRQARQRLNSKPGLLRK
jgi:hypothetical protein